MIIVPVVVLILLFMSYYVRNKNAVRSLANTWLTVVFFVWLQTELLSAFKAWTSVSVLLTWVLFLLLLLALGYKRKLYIQLKNFGSRNEDLFEKCRKYKTVIILFAVYFFFVLIMGCLSSQYNMDSMVYHLPRIMYWIQNKSVGHFAPGIEFQVRYPSLTEYLVAQIYLAGCSDRLANLVQTGAYLFSAIMVFGIGRKIGASVKAAFTSAFVYLMMPMALAQAFTTQTDNVAGLFLLIFVFYILDFIQCQELKMDRRGFVSALRLAASVMFGYLCKPTICFVMLVFFIWMCIVRLYKKDNIMVLLRYVLVGVLVAAVLYIPLYVKSYQTYTVVNRQVAEQNNSEDGEEILLSSSVDRVLAPDVFNVKNALLNPTQFVVNCLQNLGRNSTSICFPKYNEEWQKLITKVGGWLKYDVSTYRTQTDALFFYHDTASNPCIMLLILLACICVCTRISKPTRIQTVYMICAVLGMLAQCGLMGFTQYRTRYLVGAMAVSCPMVAVAIDRIRLREGYRDILLSLVIFAALIGGVNTYSYELPRIRESFEGEKIHQYMLGNEEDEYVYSELIRIINEEGFTQIGVNHGVYMEYVLWQGIDNLERLENVNVTDIYFSQYEDLTFIPDCIVRVVAEEEEVKEGDLMECHGKTYQCIWSIHWYQSYYCLFSLI